MRPIDADYVRGALVAELWRENDDLEDRQWAYGYAAGVYFAIRKLAETPTLTPPNEPLDLEQLREMDGEPVWVVYDQDAAKTTPGFDPLALWALAEVGKNAVRLTNKFGGRTAYANDQELEWAGITVYRRPPEGEEDT